MESNRERVGRNVRQLRGERGYTVRGLSAVLDVIGHRIAPSSITKIESGVRAADPDDLVALAIALGVNPNRLLLPFGDRREEIALTPRVTAAAFQAWPWAQGDAVLVEGEVAAGRDEREYGEAQDDFRRHTLPASERLRDDHTAVRAARDVVDSIRALLDRRDNPERYVPEDSPLGKSLTKAFGATGGTPAAVRLQLARLVAEVDALIGDDDGER